ncbi:MAG: DnaJ domain-containing protein [Ketobacter sp.]|nr:DnaJ domain-containing protein [Ketobacter sp.]
MNTSQQNPLIPDILAILRRNLASLSAAPYGVHHLLTELSDHPVFESLDCAGELSLFKKNFLIMNGLHRLRRALWAEERLLLQIETLDVRLLVGGQSSMISDDLPTADPMAEYYLDWHHYHETTQEQVDALLDSFWNRFEKAKWQHDALQVLGLGQGASMDDIKRRYQALARQHHPDRGGDPAHFIEIRQAYEALRC